MVHVSERTWAKWEGDEGNKDKHRFPGEAYIELFCLKQGLVYPLKFDQKAPEEEEEKSAEVA